MTHSTLHSGMMGCAKKLHCRRGQAPRAPGRVGHDDAELAQHGHVEGADVALDPLRLAQRLRGRGPSTSSSHKISGMPTPLD